MPVVKVGIAGGAGRMGRMLVEAVLADAGLALAAVSEAPGHPLVGQDIATALGRPAIGVRVVDDSCALAMASDVLIDFTRPAACRELLAAAVANKRAMVIGTTGLGKEDEEGIRQAARAIPIVKSANMSVGVNLLLALVEQVAARLDEGFDVEISEAHHRHKADAPSGTALALGRAAARGRGVDLETHATMARHGVTGERRPGSIGFSVVRAGDIVGEHTVLFAAEGERLELTHKATSRAIFARGALRAVHWLASASPGLYSMTEVLGVAGAKTFE